jgi:hypothetical protein
VRFVDHLLGLRGVGVLRDARIRCPVVYFHGSSPLESFT